jgi:hypothetical protein
MRVFSFCAVGLIFLGGLTSPMALGAQQYPTQIQIKHLLINRDIVEMVHGKISDSTILEAINAGPTNFDLSGSGIVSLKSAGVSETIIKAMISSGSKTEQPIPANSPNVIQSTQSGNRSSLVVQPQTQAPELPVRLVVKEGTDVHLRFAQDLSSKSAEDGDSVALVLDEDLKVGDVTVARAGAKAVGTVTNSTKAGMMGKSGDLSMRLEYLIMPDSRLRLRGSKGREGEGKEDTAIVLTILFGPIGLIKHGKNVTVKQGTPITVYVDQDFVMPVAR